MEINETIFNELKEKCTLLEKENSELKKQLSDVPTRLPRNIIDILDTEIKSMFGYTADTEKMQLKYTNNEKLIKSNFDKLRNTILRILSPIVKPRSDYRFDTTSQLTFIRIDEYTDEEYDIAKNLLVDICQQIYDAQVVLRSMKSGDNNV